jgi:hypothetical protein
MGFYADLIMSSTKKNTGYVRRLMNVRSWIRVIGFTYVSFLLFAGKVRFDCCSDGLHLWTARYVNIPFFSRFERLCQSDFQVLCVIARVCICVLHGAFTEHQIHSKLGTDIL